MTAKQLAREIMNMIDDGCFLKIKDTFHVSINHNGSEFDSANVSFKKNKNASISLEFTPNSDDMDSWSDIYLDIIYEMMSYEMKQKNRAGGIKRMESLSEKEKSELGEMAARKRWGGVIS